MKCQQIAPRTDCAVDPDRMPRPAPRGMERLTDIEALYYCYAKFKRGEDTYTTTATRRVLGVGLPDWQRPLKWTEEHMVRFVVSCWQGRNIGHWIINVLDDGPAELDGLLIDGQQRLTSLERYFDDQLAVQSVDGARLYWSDLTTKEQRRFLRTSMPSFTVSYTDEDELKRLSDLLNFSGVPHTEEERAIPLTTDLTGTPSTV
ncbi:DUF262 domain-containing protein [Paraburkholderia youngii]|uniref:DUF262 domain-containing protein n=1 Tax=Paraburkholderia youngii TaxID=2782701 RepID=UPI003D22C235